MELAPPLTVSLDICAAYEKLKMYGFYIHACVDGGSNFVMWATLASDKASQTLFMGYQQAMQRYGRPLKVRADMCFEAHLIADDIISANGHMAYIAGPSTSNTVRHSAA